VKRPKGGGPLERFVLKPFSKKEEEQLKEVKERAYGALPLVLTSGLETAMNKFN
jgi:peptidyl-tRNA hydrolase